MIRQPATYSRRGPAARRIGATVLAAGLVTVVSVGTGAASAHAFGLSRTAARSADSVAGTATYLVVLRPAPLATYAGNLPGYGRTAPRHGQRFDAGRPAVRAYENHLLSGQTKLLTEVGSPAVLYRYTTVLDGFAASLTSDEVASLRAHSDVLTVEPSRLEHLAGAPSDNTLGVKGKTGVWREVGGPARAGRGTVVGVVDSGIWPENPSFAAVPLDRATVRTTYPGFTGSCQPGERWKVSTCNAKVLAARAFVAGFGISHLSAAEFASPRDGTGHGSHTASIAAGNAGVDVSVGKQHFGQVAGVAPGAGLAVYKACWAAPDPVNDGCSTPDTTKAIDQAVRDGVDVLNYSVSGAGDALTNVTELAFLNAASAGVFISTAAGDDGPAAGTVSHSGPWMTTVAAGGTEAYQGSVRLGNGQRFTGAMVSDRSVSRARLVDARTAPARGASPDQAADCLPGSLDASKVDATIVICTRGADGRVTKSQTVDRAGGTGMILVNDTPGTTYADLHAVPTVHVTVDAAASILDYVSHAARPTASLNANGGHRLPPSVADFSSRGPASVTDGNILKPDVAAPGVGVLAAVAPPSDFGRLWDLYSGSSMAAPIVSGLAAIAASQHPSWSPAMTKSALMTTARPMATDLPLDQGAGEVAGRSMLDPGLVYPAGRSDWLTYLRRLAVEAKSPVVGAAGTSQSPAIGPNSPSIAVGSLVGEQTVRRTVTNVSASTETYVAHVDGLRGIAVSVSRPTLTLRPTQSATFDVTFSARRSAHYQHFASGALTWRGSLGHTVRSPIVVRPELVDAPSELTADGRSGSVRVTARAGVTGTIVASTLGLVGARPTGFVLQAGAFDLSAPRPSASTSVEAFDVPDHTALARFEIRIAHASDDVELYVYRDGQLVGTGADGDSGEQVTLTDPKPGRYTVYVHVATAVHDVSLGSLTGWVLDDTSRPAVAQEASAPLAIDPARVDVTGGQTFRLGASWHGLGPSRRWLAVLSYADSTNQTFVTVN